MDNIYEYQNEKFSVEQDKNKCEYVVKHIDWAEPVITVYIRKGTNPNVHSWAAKGPNVSIGTNGSFQGALNVTCNHIISMNDKGPTYQERCQEGEDFFGKL